MLSKMMALLMTTLVAILPLSLAYPPAASLEINPSPSPQQAVNNIDLYTILQNSLRGPQPYDRESAPTDQNSSTLDKNSSPSDHSSSSLGSLRSRVKFLAVLTYLRQLLVNRGLHTNDVVANLLNLWRPGLRGHHSGQKRNDFGLSVRRTRYTSLGSPILKSTNYKTNSGSENLFRYGRSIKGL